MAIDPITIQGTFYEADGTTPATGTVEFILTHELRDTTDNRIYVRSSEKYTLVDGAIPAGVTLIPTTHPDLAPSGAQYLVRQEFPTTKLVREYHISVPHDSGSILDLADVSEGTAGIVSYARDHWNIREFAYDEAGQAVTIDDGTTDATFAYTAMLNAMRAAGGGRGVIPGGTYLLDPRASADILDGDDQLIDDGLWVEGAGPDVTILKLNAATVNAMPDDGRDIKFIMMGSNGRISNLTIDGDAASWAARTDPIACVLLAVKQGYHNPTIEHVYLRNCYGTMDVESWALGLSRTQGGRVDGVRIYDSGGSGMSLAGSYPSNLPTTGVTITDFKAARCKWAGITFFGASDCVLDGFEIDDCGNAGGTPATNLGNGVNLEYASDILLANGFIRRSYKFNVSLLGAVRNCQFSNVITEEASNATLWGAVNATSSEIRCAQQGWANAATYVGVPQGVRFDFCQFRPTTGNPVVNYGDLDTTSLPESKPNNIPTSHYDLTFSNCIDGSGQAPADWFIKHGTTSHRILGSLRVPTLRDVKSYTTPAFNDAAWTRGASITVTSGLTVTGQKALGAAWQITAAAGTGPQRTLYWTLPQQQGKQAARLRIMPTVGGGLLYQIGFMKSTTSGFFGQWRWTPVTSDMVGQWLDITTFSQWSDVDTDHTFAITLANTCALYVDGLPLLTVVDPYGALV